MVNGRSIASALLLAASSAAHSADFSVKPARIVVPIGAGRSMDIGG